MEELNCLAIIGLTSLENIGLRSILHDMWKGRVECFSKFKEFGPFADRMNGYIVSSDCFLCNVEFFLPRKSKTMIIATNCDESSMTEEKNLLSVRWDEADIIGAISKYVSGLGDNEIPRGELSTREIEVLRLIASGNLNKEIADKLCISVNTVITHRKNISTKLGIKSASGLSLYAMMNGILKDPLPL